MAVQLLGGIVRGVVSRDRRETGGGGGSRSTAERSKGKGNPSSRPGYERGGLGNIPSRTSW